MSANGIEKPNIVVVGMPVVDAAPLYLAQEKGLFKKQGLNVTVKTVTQSTLAIPGMLRGDIDISIGNYVSFLQANAAKALDVRIVSEGYQCDKGVIPVVATDPGIKSAQDLKGKKIGINLLNSVNDMTVNAVLRSNNVAPSSVKYTQVPFPEMGAALQKKQVDAVLMVEPFATSAAQKLGAHKVIDGCEGPTAKEPISGYMSTSRFADKNPKTVAAFQRALRTAQGMAADRRVVEKQLPKYSKINATTASVITLGSFPSSTSSERLQRVADLMKAAGLLKEELDMKKIVVPD